MATTHQLLQTSQRPLTVADFESFPDDGNRYEIMGGMLSVSPAPTLDHQRIALRIAAALELYFDDVRTGEVFIAPVDVELSNFDVIEPDVVVVLDANASIKHKRRIVGAPDIVVEVISPSSAKRDRVRKAALYAINGVREYWLVDPERNMFEVLALRRGNYTALRQPEGFVQSQVLDGFQIELARLFRAPTAGTRTTSESDEPDDDQTTP